MCELHGTLEQRVDGWHFTLAESSCAVLAKDWPVRVSLVGPCILVLEVHDSPVGMPGFYRQIGLVREGCP